MAFGYSYRLEQQENGWLLVRFPKVPEALTEGETEEEARALAADALLVALEGYLKAGRAIPEGDRGRSRIVLPSLITAKLAVYRAMRDLAWTKQKLADELGTAENSIRRLLNLRHSSHMRNIDEALAVMGRELEIDAAPRPAAGNHTPSPC
jgi:antitoxin HicB